MLSLSANLVNKHPLRTSTLQRRISEKYNVRVARWVTLLIETDSAPPELYCFQYDGFDHTRISNALNPESSISQDCSFHEIPTSIRAWFAM